MDLNIIYTCITDKVLNQQWGIPSFIMKKHYSTACNCAQAQEKMQCHQGRENYRKTNFYIGV